MQTMVNTAASQAHSQCRTRHTRRMARTGTQLDLWGSGLPILCVCFGFLCLCVQRLSVHIQQCGHKTLSFRSSFRSPTPKPRSSSRGMPSHAWCLEISCTQRMPMRPRPSSSGRWTIAMPRCGGKFESWRERGFQDIPEGVSGRVSGFGPRWHPRKGKGAQGSYTMLLCGRTSSTSDAFTSRCAAWAGTFSGRGSKIEMFHSSRSFKLFEIQEFHHLFSGSRMSKLPGCLCLEDNKQRRRIGPPCRQHPQRLLQQRREECLRDVCLCTFERNMVEALYKSP